MKNRQIIGCLIGLTGAVGSKSKTPNTDRLVREALLSEDSQDMVNRIRREKYTIAPDCARCPAPCGNTSDYDPARFDLDPENLRILKEALVEKMAELSVRTAPEEELPEILYRALSYLGCELEYDTYKALLEEMNAC